MDKRSSLPPIVRHITCDQMTEPAFQGEYTDLKETGRYLCRQCGIALFRSQDKFHSGCGWPSFDATIAGTIKRLPDPDGQRIEIRCERCGAHLGHVFEGEALTPKNTRYCVNSLSLDFVTDSQIRDTEEAIFAGGGFWGVEYYFKRLPGVVKTEVGYTGGHKNNPTYKEVCSRTTGHVEAIRVLYDPQQINYEKILHYFFEIHDPTQTDGQGPDLGDQYHSVIFYYDNQQKRMAEMAIKVLTEKGYRIATRLAPVSIFWRAEDYHQDYYQKTGKQPYCHHYVKRF
ncbi:methionine sulfoxide reductase [Coxiella burnetii]|uniref:bifunctional methionine sulfoxide reductase B/A protein n=1 Tax=Coxiella burnetii TaxID=777 RepID=UPI000C04BA72|nr:bifunctional methionine sulfoxide reductase B/A protein [Coxiella burnetii]ATN70682.1 methionine sulfoxide reductase [Coxiella burnetii]